MKDFIKKPPMGWNSWDCYGAGVTEDELLGNAVDKFHHPEKYKTEEELAIENPPTFAELFDDGRNCPFAGKK